MAVLRGSFTLCSRTISTGFNSQLLIYVGINGPRGFCRVSRGVYRRHQQGDIARFRVAWKTLLLLLLGQTWNLQCLYVTIDPALISLGVSTPCTAESLVIIAVRLCLARTSLLAGHPRISKMPHASGYIGMQGIVGWRQRNAIVIDCLGGFDSSVRYRRGSRCCDTKNGALLRASCALELHCWRGCA
jgi:hypothetical protein